LQQVGVSPVLSKNWSMRPKLGDAERGYLPTRSVIVRADKTNRDTVRRYGDAGHLQKELNERGVDAFNGGAAKIGALRRRSRRSSGDCDNGESFNANGKLHYELRASVDLIKRGLCKCRTKALLENLLCEFCADATRTLRFGP
jgi:hypothetical protein